MRITTLVKNYFTYFILLLSLLGYNETVYSQCPTVTNSNQTFCDTQSPTVANLVATNNGGGIRWYDTATTPATDFLSSSTPLETGDYYVDDNTGACGPRQVVNVTVYSKPVAIFNSITFCQPSTVANLNGSMIGKDIRASGNGHC